MRSTYFAEVILERFFGNAAPWWAVSACFVAAVAVVNVGESTAFAASVTADTAAPTVPTNVIAVAGEPGQATVSWAASSDDVGVDTYRILVGDELTSETSALSAEVAGLAPGEHSVVVVAVDAAGNESEPSSEALVTISQSDPQDPPAPDPPAPDNEAPTAPNGLVAVADSDGSVALSWDASSDNVGVESYSVFDDGVAVTTTTEAAAALTNLAIGSHTFTVTATDAAGNESAPSSAAAATVEPPPDTTAPSTPSGVEAAVDLDGVVEVTWTASTDDVGVLSYEVREGEAVLDATSALSMTLADLSIGEHSLSVVALDGAGNVSEPSPPIDVMVTAPDPVVLSGVDGLLARPVVSASGSWRAVLELKPGVVSGGVSNPGQVAGVWRSVDGVSWERVSLPAGWSAPSTASAIGFGVDDDGSVLLSSHTTMWSYRGGVWSQTSLTGAYGYYRMSLVSSGDVWVAVDYNSLLFSTDRGQSWTKSVSLPGSTTWEATAIGDKVHLIASGRYLRWDVNTRTLDTVDNVAFPGAGRVVSVPGSVSSLIAMVPTAGSFRLWRSDDGGGAWVAAGGVASPVGMVEYPTMLDDGRLHMFGVADGFMTESSMDVSSFVWSDATRWPVVSGDRSVVWPTQRADGAQLESAMWLIQTRSGSPAKFGLVRALGAGESAVEVDQVADGSLVLSGVDGLLVRPVVSASGSWRAVLELKPGVVSGGVSNPGQVAGVWRSVDGVSWERVSLPAGWSAPSTASAIGFGVDDDGSVLLSSHTTMWSYRGGVWSQTSLTGAYGYYRMSLVSSGDVWVAVDYNSLLFSTDRGQSWTKSVSLPGSTTWEATAIGDKVHLIASGRYLRWDVNTRTLDTVDNVAFPGAGRVVSVPGSVSSLIAMVPTAGSFRLWRSDDGGGAWVAAGGVASPVGMVEYPTMLDDGRLHMFGVADGFMTESSMDVSSFVWSDATRWPVVSGDRSVVWPTQRADGAQLESAMWLIQTRSGSPAKFGLVRALGAGESAVEVDQVADGSLVLSGVDGLLARPVVSASGSWRAVLELKPGVVSGGVSNPGQVAGVWRSVDGVSWERVSLPAGWSAPSTASAIGFGVDDDGSVLLSSHTTMWSYRGGVWSQTSLTGAYGYYRMSLVSSGDVWVAVDYNSLLFSTDRGQSWTKSVSLPGSTTWEATAIGDKVHLIASGRYLRWDVNTRTLDTVDNVAFPGAGRVVSVPGSVSSLIAMVPTAGSFRLWRSDDGGGAWVAAGGVASPVGMVEYPTMLDDGRLHMFGVADGFMTESSMDVSSFVWSDATRWPVVSGDRSVVWPTQRADGAQLESAMWLIQTRSGSPAKFGLVRALGAGESAVEVDQVADGSLVLSGVDGLLVRPVVSASGSWRAVLELKPGVVSGGVSNPGQVAGVWRSVDGVSWERVSLPAGWSAPSTASAIGFGVDDDGSVLLSSHTTMWSYRGGVWSQTSLTGAYGYYRMSLVSSGDVWVAVDYNSLLFSTDRGQSWTKSVSLPGSTTWEATAIGDKVHLIASGRYLRWDVNTRTLDTVDGAGIGISHVADVDGSAENLVGIKLNASSMELRTSSDAGGTWAPAGVTEFPYQGGGAVDGPDLSGVAFGTPRVTADGRIVLVGTATEDAEQTVYGLSFETATGSWAAPIRVETGESAGGLLAFSLGSETLAEALAVRSWWVTQRAGGFDARLLDGQPEVLDNPDPVESETFESTSDLALPSSTGNLRSPRLSSDGAWRIVVDDDVVWRSQDGATWDRLVVPVALTEPTEVAVDGTGTVVVMRAGSASEPSTLSYSDGTWNFGAQLNGQAPAELLSIGDDWIYVTAGGNVHWSTDSAATWEAGGSLNVGISPSATVIDDVLHVSGSTGAARWSIIDRTQLGTTDPDVELQTIGSLADGTLVAHRLIGTLLHVRTSADDGATWSTASIYEMPVRAGFTFESPHLTSAGALESFAPSPVAVEPHVLVASLDVVSREWATIERIATPGATGPLVHWTRQQPDRTFVGGGLWRLGDEGAVPVTADRTESAWPTTVVTFDSPVTISGQDGPLSGQRLSPDGQWSLRTEMNASADQAIWRSNDNAQWERIPLSGRLSVQEVVIDNDGTVTVFYNSGYRGRYVYSVRFFDGEWHSPAGVGYRYYYPAAVVSDGSTMVSISTSGRVSWTDDGRTWYSASSLGTGSVTSAVVSDGVLHLTTSGGHYRWSMSAKIQVGEFDPAPAGATVFVAPDSSTNLIAVRVDYGAVRILESNDAGETWSTPTTTQRPFRDGMSFDTPAVDDAGNLVLVASSIEGDSTGVYTATWDRSTAQWQEITRSVVDRPGAIQVARTQTPGASTTSQYLVRVSDGTFDDVGVDLATGVPARLATTLHTFDGGTIEGFGASPTKPAWSPNGVWRMLSENRAVWRSSDGVTWERIPYPTILTAPVLGISDDGDILAIQYGGYRTLTSTTFLFADGEWSEGLKFFRDVPTSVTSVGTDWLYVNSVGVRSWSGDGGDSWEATPGVTVGSDSVVSIVGDAIFVSGSAGTIRVSASTRELIGELDAGVTRAVVGRITEGPDRLLAVQATNGLNLVWWESADGGSTWSEPVTTPKPFREGATWNTPSIAENGQVQVVGVRTAGQVKEVYEMRYQIASRTWAPASRRDVTTDASALVVWPANLEAQPSASAETWLTTEAEAVSVTADPVSDGWPVSTSVSTDDAVIVSQSAAGFGDPIWSPSGSWRAVPEADGSGVWRSQDGSAWERIPSPASLSSADFGISDDGAILVTWPGAYRTRVSTVFSFRDGEWFEGERLFRHGPSMVGAMGSTWYMLTASGGFLTSADDGASWTSTALGVGAPVTVSSLDGTLHLSGPLGYVQWTEAGGLVFDDPVAAVASAKIWSSATGELVAMRVLGRGVDVWKSEDAGVTWLAARTDDTPYDPGVGFGSPQVTPVGGVRLFGSKTVGSEVIVHSVESDPSTGAWGPVMEHDGTLAPSSLVLWPAHPTEHEETSSAWVTASGPAGDTIALRTLPGASPQSWTADPIVGTAEQPLADAFSNTASPTLLTSLSGEWGLALGDGSLAFRTSTLDTTTPTWLPITLPSGFRPALISDDGEILAFYENIGWCCSKSYLSAYVFSERHWTGPFGVGRGRAYNDRTGSATTDGAEVFASTRHGLSYSSDDFGRTWSSGGVIGLGDSSAVSLRGIGVQTVGETVHAMEYRPYFGWFDGADVYSYSRWDYVDEAIRPFPEVEVEEGETPEPAPSFVTELGDRTNSSRQYAFLPDPQMSNVVWRVLTGTGFGMSLQVSGDRGDTWMDHAITEPAPMRDGVTFTQATMLSSNEIALFGSRPAQDGVEVFEVRWDIDLGRWSTPASVLVEDATGSVQLVSQPQTPEQVAADAEVYVVGGGGNVWAVGARAPDPWVTTTEPSSGSVLIDDITGTSKLDRYESSSGEWQLVRSGRTLWRSDSTMEWERFVLPAEVPTTNALAILDNGEVVVAWARDFTYSPGQTVIYVHYYRDEGWFGSQRVSDVDYRSTAAAVFAKNDILGVVTSKGIVIYTDRSEYDLPERFDEPQQLWKPGNVVVPQTADPTEQPVLGSVGAGVHAVDVVGNVAHIFGAGGGYSRWSMTTKQVIPFEWRLQEPAEGSNDPAIELPLTVIGLGGTNPRSAPADGTVDDILFVSGGQGLITAESDSGGAQVSDPVGEGYPVGATDHVLAAQNELRSYGVATCTTGSLVFAYPHAQSTEPGFSRAIPVHLDETRTAALIQRPQGRSLSSDTHEVWFTTSSGQARSLVAVDSTLASPESVFGYDGYGITANGVNVSIGNFTHTDTDAAVSTVGPSLGIQRSYNSADGRVGMFGRGWTSNYETRVFENCVTGDATVLHGDGRREHHPSNGAGGYSVPEGYPNQLIKTSTGWTLSATDGTVTTFRGRRSTPEPDRRQRQLDRTRLEREWQRESTVDGDRFGQRSSTDLLLRRLLRVVGRDGPRDFGRRDEGPRMELRLRRRSARRRMRPRGTTTSRRDSAIATTIPAAQSRPWRIRTATSTDPSATWTERLPGPKTVKAIERRSTTSARPRPPSPTREETRPRPCSTSRSEQSASPIRLETRSATHTTIRGSARQRPTPTASRRR